MNLREAIEIVLKDHVTRIEALEADVASLVNWRDAPEDPRSDVPDNLPARLEALEIDVEALEVDMTKLRSCGLALQLGLDEPPPGPSAASGGRCAECGYACAVDERGVVVCIQCLREQVEDLQRSRPLGCYDCGRRYEKGPDLVVSDKDWAKIAPHNGQGVLCPNCMHDRFVALGVPDGSVSAEFKSGPFVCHGTGAAPAREYGDDTPWPLHEFVARLADAAEHLLHDHSCDAHGHEGIKYALEAARKWLAHRDGIGAAAPPLRPNWEQPQAGAYFGEVIGTEYVQIPRAVWDKLIGWNGRPEKAAPEAKGQQIEVTQVGGVSPQPKAQFRVSLVGPPRCYKCEHTIEEHMANCPIAEPRPPAEKGECTCRGLDPECPNPECHARKRRKLLFGEPTKPPTFTVTQADWRALRDENEKLRRDLARAEARKQELAERCGEYARERDDLATALSCRDELERTLRKALSDTTEERDIERTERTSLSARVAGLLQSDKYLREKLGEEQQRANVIELRNQFLEKGDYAKILRLGTDAACRAADAQEKLDAAESALERARGLGKEWMNSASYDVIACGRELLAAIEGK